MPEPTNNIEDIVRKIEVPYSTLEFESNEYSAAAGQTAMEVITKVALDLKTDGLNPDNFRYRVFSERRKQEMLTKGTDRDASSANYWARDVPTADVTFAYDLTCFQTTLAAKIDRDQFPDSRFLIAVFSPEGFIFSDEYVCPLSFYRDSEPEKRRENLVRLYDVQLSQQLNQTTYAP